MKRGITSFQNPNDSGGVPEFTFAEFKRVVFAVADPHGLAVTSLSERGVTPNFHSAQLSGTTISTIILGHSTFPIVAFSDVLDLNDCQLRFVNCNQLAAETQRLFSHVTVADSKELTRELVDSDLELLDETERKQIEYWKPNTVGEVAFNWWD